MASGKVNINNIEFEFTESEDHMVHEGISARVFQAEFIRPIRAFNRKNGKAFKIVKHENPTSYQIFGRKNGNKVERFVEAYRMIFGYSVRYDNRIFTKQINKKEVK
jgi:hypothetical protein